MPVQKNDQAKTAFGAPWGLYEFKRMPFSLHGAVEMFQRLIDWALAPHQRYAAAYLADIIIYSNKLEQHLKALWAVLQEL